jgi:hypothetical protein
MNSSCITVSSLGGRRRQYFCPAIRIGEGLATGRIITCERQPAQATVRQKQDGIRFTQLSIGRTEVSSRRLPESGVVLRGLVSVQQAAAAAAAAAAASGPPRSFCSLLGLQADRQLGYWRGYG